MIKSIRHKGLKRYFTRQDASRLPAEYLPRINRMLLALDDAARPENLNVPGYHFHKLTGDMKDFYSIRVTGNYRMIFRFEDGHAHDVDLIDYH